MLSRASARSVAVWHDLAFGGYLMSELGPVTGTPVAERHHGHCAVRESCAVMSAPLGQCLIFSTALLADLDSGLRRYQNLDAVRRADVVDLTVDHVGTSGVPASWTYRLMSLRWRNNDPHDYADPGLQLGIWPD
jgi:hypothetical protein